ncbi:hypothetical protein KM043_010523 [Ampulex compressa]|nr:hypothetical protein KM043_010523 [Ampulex compressa]
MGFSAHPRIPTGGIDFEGGLPDWEEPSPGGNCSSATSTRGGPALGAGSSPRPTRWTRARAKERREWKLERGWREDKAAGRAGGGGVGMTRRNELAMVTAE